MKIMRWSGTRPRCEKFLHSPAEAVGRFSDENSIVDISIFKKIAKTTAPRCSHDVANRSIRRAFRSLTLEIERDPVRPTKYGRSCHKPHVQVL